MQTMEMAQETTPLAAHFVETHVPSFFEALARMLLENAVEKRLLHVRPCL